LTQSAQHIGAVSRWRDAERDVLRPAHGRDSTKDSVPPGPRASDMDRWLPDNDARNRRYRLPAT
jgi:hypothetical protein